MNKQIFYKKNELQAPKYNYYKIFVVEIPFYDCFVKIYISKGLSISELIEADEKVQYRELKNDESQGSDSSPMRFDG